MLEVARIIQMPSGGLLRRLLRMRRRLRAIMRAMIEVGGLPKVWDRARGGPVMITLTYRPGVEWESRHISDFLRWCWRRLGGRRPYVWVAELQERGAVHYHILIWYRRGDRLPKPDLAGGWAYGMSQIAAAKKSAMSYLLKYLSKGIDRVEGMGGAWSAVAYPKGLRIFGAGMSGMRAVWVHASWSLVPGWVLRQAREWGARIYYAVVRERWAATDLGTLRWRGEVEWSRDVGARVHLWAALA